MEVFMFGFRKREKRYVKPVLVLKGRMGKRIYDEIMNTPKFDFSQLDKELEEEEARILATRKHEGK